MSVSIELTGDCVGIARDDGVEVGAPDPHTVHMAGGDVTQDVNLKVIEGQLYGEFVTTFSPFNSASCSSKTSQSSSSAGSLESRSSQRFLFMQ